MTSPPLPTLTGDDAARTERRGRTAFGLTLTALVIGVIAAGVAIADHRHVLTQNVPPLRIVGTLLFGFAGFLSLLSLALGWSARRSPWGRIACLSQMGMPIALLIKWLFSLVGMGN